RAEARRALSAGERREGEAFVAVGGHFLATLAVRREPADVGHENPGLAGNVGADVPGVGLGEEGEVGHLPDALDPRLFGPTGGLDPCEASLAEEADAVRDPLHVLLDGER